MVHGSNASVHWRKSRDWRIRLTFALDIEAVSSAVQLQMGRTHGTSAGSTWMGSDSNGFHLGTVGAIRLADGNSVSDPNGFTVNTSGNVGIGVTPEAHYGGYEVLDIEK